MCSKIKILGCLWAAGLAIAGCGDDDPTNQGGDLTFPEQKRTATLDFASGDETYLVTVFSSPGISEASPTGDLLYELAPTPSANTSSLRMKRLARSQNLSTVNADYWKARSSFENDRHERLGQLALEMSSRGERFAQSQALRAACSCDEGQTCTPGTSTCVDTLSLKFSGATRSFDVIGSVTRGDLKITVISDAPEASPAQLTSIAEDFGDAAATVLEVMGQSAHEGALDVDGSGSITIAFTSDFGDIDPGVVGFFEFGDFLTTGQSGATGNRADILWARAPTASITRELLIGTLAHEYQHLASFALRSDLGDPATVREVLWLDEGLSHVMEDLTGWGGSTVDAYAQALDHWDNASFAGPEDPLPLRGRAYMLLRFLVDQRARAKGAADAKANAVVDAARELISPLYQESRRGFQHALFQDARNDGRFVDAIRAVYTTGNTSAPEATASRQFLPTATSPRANGQLIGFNPFEIYTTASGAEVPLAGPASDDSNDSGFTEAISDSIVASGARFYLVTGGEGNVSLTLSADNNTDISLDALRVQ